MTLFLFFAISDIFKVYCADHTYTTLKLQMDSTVDQIIQYAADKIGDDRDLVLCEVKSTGGIILKA